MNGNLEAGCFIFDRADPVDSEQAQLSLSFKGIEIEGIGEGTREKLHLLMHGLLGWILTSDKLVV